MKSTSAFAPLLCQQWHYLIPDSSKEAVEAVVAACEELAKSSLSRLTLIRQGKEGSKKPRASACRDNATREAIAMFAA